jgi:hypothetical protein
MNTALDGVLRKIERGESHLESLQREANSFIRRQTDGIVRQLDAAGATHNYRLTTDPTAPRHWSAAVGDVLHNFRSALDHLAWQLVLANGGRPTKRTSFPLLLSPPGVGRAPSVFGGVSAEALDIIESLQPYHQEDKANRDALWLLHDLNRVDKHRTLLVAIVAIDFGRWGVPDGVPSPTANFSPRPLRRDSPIATFKFPSPQPDVHLLDLEFRLEIFLHEGPPAGENPLLRVLTYIDTHLRRYVLPRFGQFF